MVSPIPDSASRPSASVAPGDGGSRVWARVLLGTIYVAAVAIAARLLASVEDAADLPWYIGFLTGYFVLFTLVWLRPRTRSWLLHLIFVVQCLLVLGLLALEPDFDYATSLLVPLGYQASLVFHGRTRWVWAVALVLLIGASLMVSRGPIEGLGLALTTMAVGLAFPALAVAGQEIEAARARSRMMVAELEVTHRRLEKYAAEVNDLAVMEERNRLARELHDSVSQAMFGIVLATRSAQMMRATDPQGTREQLERLQELTQEALIRMRGFIADLRPKTDPPA